MSGRVGGDPRVKEVVVHTVEDRVGLPEPKVQNLDFTV